MGPDRDDPPLWKLYATYVEGLWKSKICSGATLLRSADLTFGAYICNLSAIYVEELVKTEK